MKLIAKRLITTREVAYVQGFSSRPTLHYRVVEGPPEPNAPAPAFGTGRSYTFTESVERWGDLLSQSSLEPVRRKALQSFRGCLEQYFVVLSDFQDPEEVDIISKIVSGRGRPGYGRRPAMQGAGVQISRVLAVFNHDPLLLPALPALPPSSASSDPSTSGPRPRPSALQLKNKQKISRC